MPIYGPEALVRNIEFNFGVSFKPYAFISFGAMDVTKPYEFIGFGAMDVTKPYEFIGFGAPSCREHPRDPSGCAGYARPGSGSTRPWP